MFWEDKMGKWLQERQNDTELLSKSSIISDQVNKLILKPSSQEERKKLLELINSLYKSAQYESIKLVDVNGNTILAIPNNTSPICPESKNFISEARKSGKVIFSDFFKNTLEYKVFINFYIPIKSQSSKNNIHIAVLILQIDP